MKVLRRYLIFLLALWLPLANAWALRMPCGHATARAEVTAQSQSMKRAQVADMPCHKQTSPNAAPQGNTCDDCTHCHLSTAPALPSTASPVVAQPTATVYARGAFIPTPFIPRLPLPPPVA